MGLAAGALATAGVCALALEGGATNVFGSDATAATEGSQYEAAEMTTTSTDLREAAQEIAAREHAVPQLSRSAARTEQRDTKAAAMPVVRQAMSGGVTRTVEPTDPRDVARSMLADYGWSSDQFSCLDELYQHESGWVYTAENPTSGAYGLPQALPGEKMAAYGADWRTNPDTQLQWGFAYIRDRYGSPCGAWGVWQSQGWY